jgi:DNA sulfur modification protein DndD
MFALYGEKFLDQDSGFKEFNEFSDQEINSELYIVNVNAIREDFENEQEGVEAYVRVHFRNNDKEYSLYRSMFGIQNDSQEIFEEKGKVKLRIKKNTGNTKVVEEEEEIEKIVNSILDKGIRNYFLFDGERIERLTRATKGQKEEVAEGIKNLLNIDELNCAIKALKKLKKKFRNESKKISTGAYKKILEELDNLETKEENLETKIENRIKESSTTKKQNKQRTCQI